MPHPTRVALITGSSRGIGRAIAKQLCEDGMAVIVNYVNSQAAADEIISELTLLGSTAIAVQGDVALERDRQKLVAAAHENFGRLDVLVNNAGIGSPGRLDLLAATEDSWDKVFATNLKAPFFLSQRCANAMIDYAQAGIIPNGQIVNVSSISAFTVSTNRADYCIAKAGMQMMTWQFATRLADKNINVYEVCPGVIASDMTLPVKEKYDRMIAEGLTPIQRWGQPEDVAQAVSALVSGKFPFSTGERINVDGGFHLRRL